MDCFDFWKDFTIAYFYHTYFVTFIKGIIEQAANATAEVTHLPLENKNLYFRPFNDFCPGTKISLHSFFRFLPEGSDIHNPGV